MKQLFLRLFSFDYQQAFREGREFERKHGPGFVPWRMRGYWIGFKAGRLSVLIIHHVKRQYIKEIKENEKRYWL
jgi:hypothetical protein